MKYPKKKRSALADVVAMVIATAASAPMNNSLFTWKSTKTNFSTN